MKIDVHTHYLPDQLPNFKKKFGTGNFAQFHKCSNCKANIVNDDGIIFKNVSSNLWDQKVRLKECDDLNVDIQVISTIPIMFNYSAKPTECDYISKFINDDIAKFVNSNPKRFFGLGTIPMQNTNLAIKELDRCINELDLLGVEIGSNINGSELGDDKFFPIFKAASDIGASIFIHPWGGLMNEKKLASNWQPWLVGMPAEATRAICSLIFSGTFERLPKIRVLFAHGGGSFAGTMGRIFHGAKAKPEMCFDTEKTDPIDSLGRFYVDSIVHSIDALSHQLSVFGVDKVCLGSDYPFPLGETNPGSLVENKGDFPDSLNKRIFYQNALRWLGKIKEII